MAFMQVIEDVLISPAESDPYTKTIKALQQHSLGVKIQPA